MKVLYNEKEDILLVINPTGEPLRAQEEFKSTVKVDFDINGIPIMMEIIEASILFGVPKNKIKRLLEKR